MSLTETKLAFLDVETTGLSPALGDRIIEIGLVVCRGARETGRLDELIDPGRPIPANATAVHGLRDADVAGRPGFAAFAGSVAEALRGAWVVGHNVRFDTGFLAMELALAGRPVRPLGCLDTCQVASAVWELPDYRLDTVVHRLRIAPSAAHRATSDAEACRAIFNRAVDELGGHDRVAVADLQPLHRYSPAWPEDSREQLPGPLYDALTNGGEVKIRYVNGDGLGSRRTIRPLACFPAGRHTYVRAHCNQAGEMRTFRLDRMTVAGGPPDRTRSEEGEAGD